MAGITIVGTGSYLPGPPVTNEALARVMDTDDAWITQRTGIRQRHYAKDGEGVSDLGYEAAKRAVENARIDPKEIDYVVMATISPDYVFPGSGGLVGAKLGIPGVPALDIRQQCVAMPFAMQVADGLVASGAAKTVLVVGGETQTAFLPLDWDAIADPTRPVDPASYERATRYRRLAVLFGDGAGALVMRRHEIPGHGLIGCEIHTDGSMAKHLYIPGGGFQKRPYGSKSMLEAEEWIPVLQGKEVFKAAITKLPIVVKSLLAKHAVSLDDIDCFVAHQANDRINEAVRETLGIPKDKVPTHIARYGNTSGGTIAILMDELMREKRVKKGDLLCFLALGSGMHWGAALMRL